MGTKSEYITSLILDAKTVEEKMALTLAAWDRYSADVVAFVEECCLLKVEEVGRPSRWAPFTLWPAQREALIHIDRSPRSLALKARQLGMTWLSLAVMLHRVVFQPGSVCLIVSLREKEATEALEKLRGMYDRLPQWLRWPTALVAKDNTTTWKPGNGSEVHALPSHRGDSYTVKFALIDEASLIPNLSKLLASMDPTVADTGQICVISRANKAQPEGAFARMARKALVDGEGVWRGIFLPWTARPGRTREWYEQQRSSSYSVADNLDQLHEQYPETVTEALAPSSATTRIPTQHVSTITKLVLGIAWEGIPDLCRFYARDPDLTYVIGVDVSEGHVNGDESAVSVICRETGLEVAAGASCWEPGEALPDVIEALAAYYDADVMVERNSIGNTTINALKRRAGIRLLNGPDGKVGFYKTAGSKTSLWTEVASEVHASYNERVEGGDPTPMISSRKTSSQVATIQRNTCKAPEGSSDDQADAWALGQWARRMVKPATRGGGMATTRAEKPKARY